MNISPPQTDPGSKNSYFAPARVNLIGEHLDYNGGLVLPMALDFGMTIQFQKRTDTKIVLRSQNSPEIARFHLGDIPINEAQLWWRYPLSVLTELLEQSLIAPTTGMELTFSSAIPMGSGLSSSAALTVSTAFALLSDAGSSLIHDPVKLAKICQTVENTRIGVQCGIMDPLAIAAGQDQSALLMDCAMPKVTPIPIPFQEHSFVILDTRAPRALADSKFNERRAQCQDALKAINRKRAYEHLCQAHTDDLKLIEDPLIRKRAAHVISEQQRVLDSVADFENNNPKGFGKKLSASHRSLRDDYEVSCRELDVAVELAENHSACLGARMTGAGFGGCAIAFVQSAALTSFEAHVKAGFKNAIGHDLGFLPCVPSLGARAL
ncbi:MAG: galactokinase [Planctomycetota bacterium]|nr:galactokinase [Planctomycetota bacterium]